ncbi:PEP-CTERM sorting domain-containing protein [Duganella sp. BuS-21]|uniref:PEP-CTERM sorting domain-containing protein n=1 Tax=Duganella sp. BuS-21 TaxID=2943848 RepID=UPI0035A64A3D
MKRFPKLLIAALVAAACVPSAQAVNMVEISGAHTTFYYDADFWGLNTASVVGDKISFTTPAYFNQHAVGHGVNGTGSDRYTNRSASAVVAVAHAGYQLSGGVDYDITTTYAQATTGAWANYVNSNGVEAGSWSGNSFVSAQQVGDFTISYGRSASESGTGSGSNLTIGTSGGVSGSYQAVALNSYLFLIAEQKGAGFSDAGLSNASYAFNVSAVPEPATYLMMLGGFAALGLAGRRRRKLVGGTLLAAASLAGTAQAANYVEVTGAHVSFFYDADYWGLGAATVVGDKISFDTSSFATLNATGNTPTEKNDAIYSDVGTAAVVAVARNGYSLTGVIGFKPELSYSLSGNGGNVTLSGGEQIVTGEFANGAFSLDGDVGYASYSVSKDSNGSPSSGLTNLDTQIGQLYTGSSLFGTLALTSRPYLSATQIGLGTTITSVSYSYDFAVTAVPEPATYGMLLAGLGALALAARRKAGKDLA